MERLFRFGLTSLVASMLFSVACSSASSSTAGSGGSSAASGGRGGGSGLGGSGIAGSAGTVGSGGTSTASGGRGGSAGAAGGGGSSAAASGGTPASGGATVASGGSSGAAGSGGTRRTGTGGSAGSDGTARTGSGGAATAGTTTSTGGRGSSGGSGTGAPGGSGGTGGATSSGGAGASGATVAAGDDFVSDVKVAVHANTTTILVVTWTQVKAADNTLLEFGFSGSSVMTSRPAAGATGSHRDVVLGVPEKTAVTVRIVSKLGGVDYKTKDYQGTTGALPSGLPKPTLVSFDATLASPERWLLGSVEDSKGCSDPDVCYYNGVFWIYIMDRQARVVWYWSDPAANTSSAYPRVARDGEYLVIDKGRQGNTGVVKMTLDRQYYQFVAIAKLTDAMDVTSDGSILYDILGDLHELTKQGTNRTIWSCSKTFRNFENCYSNTVNWNAADDTVMLSFPDDGTVVQIERKTGNMVGQYGSASGSYAFSPSNWKFQYPHSPNITPQGTLILSSHLPDYPFGTPAAANHHAFEEFDIDRTNKKLTQKWIYSDGPEWAMVKGFAIRLANGNTLGNYGSGGVIREITPDKKTVFQVKFDVAGGDDYYNKMVGNNLFIDDLYALNGGGPK